jgi:putative Mg2+ transporter-C (MgtC) family protein
MMSPIEFAIKLAAAFALGAAIGFERQWQHRSAGLRTNTLVALGSAAYILISEVILGKSGDPTRIAGQIVVGVGFLGSGVIMREGFNVQGLNTAATIWCSAAVGCLSGFGLFAEAAMTAAAVVLAHLVLRPLGKVLNRRPLQRSEMNTSYYLILTADKAHETAIREQVISLVSDASQIALNALKSTTQNPQQSIISAEIVARKPEERLIEAITAKILLESGVREAHWEARTREQEY